MTKSGKLSILHDELKKLTVFIAIIVLIVPICVAASVNKEKESDYYLTVADLAKQGVLTGPRPTIRVWLSKFGFDATDEIAARDFVYYEVIPKLVRALQLTQHSALAEQKDNLTRNLVSESLAPGLLKWPHNYLGRLYGLHQGLDMMEVGLVRVVEDHEALFVPRREFDARMAAHARDTLQSIRLVRGLLGPKMFKDPEALRNHLEQSPPGTRAMYWGGREWIFVVKPAKPAHPQIS